MLVGLMFGVLNAHSVSDLTTQARSDPVLLGACYVQALERKQLYRFLGQVSDAHYLGWLGEIVKELQRHPQTATRRDGVVIGDDTVVFKHGARMPYVTLVYQSSGKRFGLGNIIVSTHYADDQKDYGLFFDSPNTTRPISRCSTARNWVPPLWKPAKHIRYRGWQWRQDHAAILWLARTAPRPRGGQPMIG